jgi:hypothetical protein
MQLPAVAVLLLLLGAVNAVQRNVAEATDCRTEDGAKTCKFNADTLVLADDTSIELKLTPDGRTIKCNPDRRARTDENQWYVLWILLPCSFKLRI